jgi:hypothetical protein
VTDRDGETDGSVEASCPYCGESVELLVDGDGGRRQDYVEDCPVCCRPWEVSVELGGDGTWFAELRTADE